jgi:hypothetical protein
MQEKDKLKNWSSHHDCPTHRDARRDMTMKEKSKIEKACLKLATESLENSLKYLIKTAEEEGNENAVQFFKIALSNYREGSIELAKKEEKTSNG